MTMMHQYNPYLSTTSHQDHRPYAIVTTCCVNGSGDHDTCKKPTQLAHDGNPQSGQFGTIGVSPLSLSQNRHIQGPISQLVWTNLSGGLSNGHISLYSPLPTVPFNFHQLGPAGNPSSSHFRVVETIGTAVLLAITPVDPHEHLSGSLGWLESYVSDEIPSRLVLFKGSKPKGNSGDGSHLPFQTTLKNRLSPYSIVIFKDIRDSVEFLFRSRLYGSGLEEHSCFFLCASALDHAISLGWTPDNKLGPSNLVNGSLCFTLTLVADLYGVSEQMLCEIKRSIEAYGEIFVVSAVHYDVISGTTIKFFLEYYDSCGSQDLIQRPRATPLIKDSGLVLSIEACCLCNVDRHALFFSGNSGRSADLGAVSPQQQYMNTFSSTNNRHSRAASSVSSWSLSTNRDLLCAWRNELSLASPNPPGSFPTSLLSPKHETANVDGKKLMVTGDDSCLAGTCLSMFVDNSSGRVSLTSLDSTYEIDLWRIQAGMDQRTTCMIRNIPNKYTQQMTIEMVDKSHRGTYDFIYLRMDFKNRCNVGYAFINFVDPRYIWRVLYDWQVFDVDGHVEWTDCGLVGKKWARFNSDKVCGLSYARIQGKAALVEKFRHSKVMLEPPTYRPKVFYSHGSQRGMEEPFPFLC